MMQTTASLFSLKSQYLADLNEKVYNTANNKKFAFPEIR